MSRDPKQAALESLHRSGFPLQTAVAKLVSEETPFEVLESEFPWLDRHGADQFLDLVIQHQSLYVSIECKKTEKEALSFLLPSARSESRTDRALIVLTRQIRDSTRRLGTYNIALRVLPETPEAEFCVVATERTGKNTRLLERDCRLLLSGCDVYALKRQRELDREARKSGGYDMVLVHVPVLVTNAPLFVAAYDPKTVSLETGRFSEAPEVESVDAVRLTKSFAAPAPRDLGHRTVFVVSVAELPTFLGSLVIQGDLAATSGGMPIG